MYSQRKKQQALDVLKRNQMNIQRTIDELGYPGISTMYEWAESMPEQILAKQAKRRPKFVMPPRLHPLKHPPTYCTIEEKFKAIHRCYDQGESPAKVAKEMGLSGGSVIYGWRQKYFEKGSVTSVKHEKDKASG